MVTVGRFSEAGWTALLRIRSREYVRFVLYPLPQLEEPNSTTKPVDARTIANNPDIPILVLADIVLISLLTIQIDLPLETRPIRARTFWIFPQF